MESNRTQTIVGVLVSTELVRFWAVATMAGYVHYNLRAAGNTGTFISDSLRRA